MEQNSGLELSPGGNKLFGWDWNKEIKDETGGKNKKELKTQFSYNRFWKLLIDLSVKKQGPQKMSAVSAASIAEMGRCENVTTDVLL